MKRDRHELEQIGMAMFAAYPLYHTQAISPVAVALFHTVMAMLAVRTRWRSAERELPALLLQIAVVAYIPFLMIDVLFLSRNVIRASAHLLFFIAAYQAVDPQCRGRHGQRMLVVALLFVASVATATHLSIILFIAAFAWLAFRQLVYISHVMASADAELLSEAKPVSRPALFYLAATSVVAILLFPMLPRVRDPFVRGIGQGLSGSSTGLGDSIDFTEARTISPDSTVVARVWMPKDGVPFFTPLRLKGSVFDRYTGNQWKVRRWSGRADVVVRRGRFIIARGSGFARAAIVQQRLVNGPRLFLPVGTFAVGGVSHLVYDEDISTGMVSSASASRGIVTYEAHIGREIEPLTPPDARVVSYPIQPEVAALAREIVGDEENANERAGRVERYMSTKFEYVPDPAALGRPVTVEEFLLRTRKGHCEYFAAGMVVLLSSLDIPARIVGGFYGGKLNPLTGYFVVQKRDAHAWVEAFDGKRWRTFDPTPASLRPGNTSSGLLGAYATALSESVNYFWDRYILTYGLADQVALLLKLAERSHELLGSVGTALRTGLGRAPEILLALMLLIAGVAAVSLLARHFRRRTLFEKLVEKLDQLGIEVTPSMTDAEVVELVRRESPSRLDGVRSILDLHLRERFSPTPPDDAARARAMAMLAELGKSEE